MEVIEPPRFDRVEYDNVIYCVAMLRWHSDVSSILKAHSVIQSSLPYVDSDGRRYIRTRLPLVWMVVQEDGCILLESTSLFFLSIRHLLFLLCEHRSLFRHQFISLWIPHME
ncbi:hypothetical protein KIN20_034472 [Parelaphostrongylus tenuis]|uniref:Uncharacterized protein n=1 Tax=Parelaphostrongylus tenuis TaxID=148309 RepID=A0AAD5RA21_PARTN|nr:hypothetical protein KIN20_034472 [Parelaphostrongylus tenuis]